jgi:asparagine N-glycosylation enzyme membrane subunit Stt3
MQISFAALGGWVLVGLAAAYAAGLWPTWAWAGDPGLRAAMLSGITIAPLMLASGLLTMLAATRGPAWAAFAFTSLSVLRMILCMLIALVMVYATDLPMLLVVVWMVGLYLAALAGEGIWICRALNRDAYRHALGEFDPKVAASGRPE